MTWLYEKGAQPGPVPVDMLADGLFTRRAAGPVQPLEFGSPFPPPEPEPELDEAVPPEVLEAQERARQVRIMVDAAREEAAAEMRGRMEADCVAEVERERARVNAVLAQFAEERARWFRKSEGEIVDLSLAVARRILHRELKTDPLSLREIAAEAVARVQEESGVILRVPPASVVDWRSAFAGRPDLEIMADATVREGDCVVDTTFGRVELGVEVQLEEVAERFREMVSGPRRVMTRSTEPRRPS